MGSAQFVLLGERPSVVTPSRIDGLKLPGTHAALNSLTVSFSAVSLISSSRARPLYFLRLPLLPVGYDIHRATTELFFDRIFVLRSDWVGS